MRPAFCRQGQLETRQKSLQEPGMPWVEGFHGRKGVLDTRIAPEDAAEFS